MQNCTLSGICHCSHHLGNVLSVFDPDLLVIGGGLSQFEDIYRLLPEYLPQYLYGVASLPAIHKARYGDSGGARRSLSQIFPADKHLFTACGAGGK